METVASPPLLLGPDDREAPALSARRRRALAAVSKARVENAWPRLISSLLAGVVAFFFFEAAWALYWMAGVVAVIFADRQLHARQLQQSEAGQAPRLLPWMLAWTVLQSAYGNMLGAMLWFSPVEPGRTMAALFIVGGLVNGAATMRHSAAFSLAAIGPSACYLIALPLAEFFLRGGNAMHLTPVIAAVLVLSWGAQLWRALRASDAALIHAEASAERERLAVANASGARMDAVRELDADLRTPLMALINAAEYLQRTAKTPAARAHMDTLAASGALLRRLIDDHANPDHFERGELEVRRAPEDPSQLAASALSAFRAAAQDKGLELFIDVAPSTPACVALDPLRVRQILYHLIANAIRSTTHGGVRLAVSADASGDPEHVMLAFVVADTGAGLSRSQQRLIFEPATSPANGLAAMQRLAQRMGGTISCESELGQGSRFTLTIAAPVVALRRDGGSGLKKTG